MSPLGAPAAVAACTLPTVTVRDGVAIRVAVGPGVVDVAARGVADGVGVAPGVLDTDGVGEADSGVGEAETTGVAVGVASASDVDGRLNTGVAPASRLEASIGFATTTGSIVMPSCEALDASRSDGASDPPPHATAVNARTPSVKSRATVNRPARQPCNNIT